MRLEFYITPVRTELVNCDNSASWRRLLFPPTYTHTRSVKTIPSHTRRNIYHTSTTLELYDRPSAPLELKIRMLTAEVLEALLYGCVTWSPRACHYDTLRRAHHRILSRCIGWRKHNRADHTISYLDTLVKTGSESIDATLRKRRILFAGFVVRIEDTRLSKCVMVGEMVGGAGCVGGQEKEWMGCFLDLRAFGINVDQWTTAAQDEGGMAQNGGTFHGKMDRRRKNQGWTTACSGMPERDGKDQREDTSSKASGLVLLRSPLLTSHK